MSTLQNKINMVQRFFSNWTDTEIHWYGVEGFDNSTLDEWIHVSYEPATKTLSTLSREMGERAIISIDILARKENRTFEIYDKLVNLVNNITIGDSMVSNIEVQGKDLVSTDNGDYRVLSIAIYLKTL